MPFTYKTRSTQYVDISNATENDRIIVTLSDGRVIALSLASTVNSFGQLEVDRDNTDETVLEELYDHIYAHIRQERYSWYGMIAGLRNKLHNWQIARHLPDRSELIGNAKLEVSVRPESDSFDDSPLEGGRLTIMATLAPHGGSGYTFSQPVESVQFTTNQPRSA